jgi:hypothetical protein
MKQVKTLPGFIPPVIAIGLALLFIPGCISLKPLPDTIQLEIENALNRGFDEWLYSSSIQVVGIHGQKRNLSTEEYSEFWKKRISILKISSTRSR